MQSYVLWNITPCSPLKVNQHLEGTCRLHLQGRRISHARNQHEAGSKQRFILVSCLVYSSTLKMEATCSCVTSVGFQRTTWRYIPEWIILHNRRCETLKSYTCINAFEICWIFLRNYSWNGSAVTMRSKVFCAVAILLFSVLETRNYSKVFIFCVSTSIQHFVIFSSCVDPTSVFRMKWNVRCTL
jgi:hypothetical protein